MNTPAENVHAFISPPANIEPAVAQALRDAVGAGGWLEDASDLEPFITEPRRVYRGHTAMVLRPASTEQVVKIVTLCREHGIAIVPQGGHTGLNGAAVPKTEGPNVVVSLARMNRVLALDADNHTITVQAGCVLADIQARAAEADRLFPLSLAAEGSCQIGGNLSTNAGGIQVLRYGNARELTLGLEVVLPDGRVWNGLRGLRKDNTGYDLKHLFVGAEGTLGIITAATLRLYPAVKERVTAFVALDSPNAVVQLLGRARAATGDQITAFEFLPRAALDLVARHAANVPDPFEQPHPWYVLMEVGSSAANASLHELLEGFLGQALEEGLVRDVALAQSGAQRAALWRVRESMFEAQSRAGPTINHDVSVPISCIPELIERVSAAWAQHFPGHHTLAFGHCGDGNVHFNLLAAEGTPREAFRALAGQVHAIAHAEVTRLHGSISAEHGIGLSKREELALHKSAVELDAMRAIKRAFDPAQLMNPGKIFTP